MKRVQSIDIVRGIVMIIMALDHVRDLLHTGSIAESPTNLATTTPILFFTRWITYLCAPIFVFLSGSSAFLSLMRKNDVRAARLFLLKRGLWLLLLEFTVVNFGMFFDPGFHLFMSEVIAAFGFGFVLLSLLIALPARAIALLGLLIIFGHDLFSLLNPASTGAFLRSLFTVNAIPLSASRVLVIAYPPIPWLGIMLTGFACGKLFLKEQVQRKRIFMWIGLGSLLLFVLLRAINIYGDPIPWSTQRSAIYSFLSFMNVSKYPPSLIFCLVTLGSMFILLSIFETLQGRFTRFALVYGRVPLFYFIVHFYIIHILLLGLLLAQGVHWNEMEFASGTFGRPKGVVTGISLGWVYIVWTGLVLLLYKPCLWYGRYKLNHTYWWLSYL